MCAPVGYSALLVAWLCCCGGVWAQQANNGRSSNYQERGESPKESPSARTPEGPRRRPSSSASAQSAPLQHSQLADMLTQLDAVWPCRPNRTLESAMTRHLLNESVHRWLDGHGGMRGDSRNNNADKALLLVLASLFSKHTYLATSGRALPPNSTITSQPVLQSLPSGSPVFAYHLQCGNAAPLWSPVAVYPTTISHSFLQVQLPELVLDACPHSQCQTHCSYSVHGGVRVYARACCTADERRVDELCRDEWILPHHIFQLVSAACVVFCSAMIGVVIRERRRQQHDRGWALMEPFFGGAIILYSIPLLGWPQHVPWGCWIAIFARQLGFTLFYGSVLLKIYRNLQEYRVRKAQHVIVREVDLIMYLLCAFVFISYGILAWSAGSWTRTSLWRAEWPQCPVEEFTVIFCMIEQLALLYGIRLCYKARNSSWIERYQFTVAVVLEALVSLVANCVRYSLNEIGSRDTLTLLAVVQLHLTISVNIAAIITPKFLVSSEGSRRALGGTMAGLGNSGRAHPSLAKMRENLINGTIDFQEVPIVDMNPEDIRAELKRVYTQLRMYKLKNAYQDNPHISKRKGGAKKTGTNETAKANKSLGVVDRKLVQPNSVPNSQQNALPNATESPKARQGDRSDRPLIAVEDDEKSDLTVESAPHNVHFLTNKLAQIGQPPSAADQSIRV